MIVDAASAPPGSPSRTRTPCPSTAGRASAGRSRRSGAHPAVGVADRRAIEQVQEPREQRVADPARRARHRARLEPAHAVAHHEPRARVELADEPRDLLEVVGQVGVDHHEVLAGRAARSRRGMRCRSRAAAPRRRRAGGARELGAAVVGAVVDDDHLAVEPVLAQHAQAARTHSSIVSASFRHGITDRDGDGRRARFGDHLSAEHEHLASHRARLERLPKALPRSRR